MELHELALRRAKEILESPNENMKNLDLAKQLLREAIELDSKSADLSQAIAGE